MHPAIVALSTAPDQETAAKIARALVEEKLAACVNIVPRVRSIYLWQDEVCDETEVLCVIKSNTSALDRLQQRLIELHPYDVPEFVTLEVTAGNLPYLQWLSDAVR